MSRPTRAVVDLAAIRANYKLATDLAPYSKTLAVVKANGYGHGAIPVAKTLEPLVPAFAVACIEEAIELRQAGIKKPILLLEGVFTADEVEQAATFNFWLMVDNDKQLTFIEQCQLNTPLTIWLGADTGMHRLGFQPAAFRAAYDRLMQNKNVKKPLVMASHFACADDVESNFTEQQMRNLEKMRDGLSGELSMANSAGVLAWPQAHVDWNRPGFMLYGLSPFDCPQINADKLIPAMTFESKVISVRSIAVGESVGYGRLWQAQRPSIIATVAVGYGDGYPRSAPSGTPVAVEGKSASLVGRVSMDMISIDVTDLDSVSVGDRVELWGKQISINDVATRCGTIGYELMTRMPGRAARHYLNTD